ncbi:MAG TPA: DUF1549 and DUF1553 domain-containing protein [Planctomycetota bacterium]|nr:DUF1549 and DUF1553 domain-containing protein [Planctomycetota bacterium]
MKSWTGILMVLGAWLSPAMRAEADSPAAGPEGGGAHWSFQRPVRHPLPVLKNPGWVRQPIDAFLLARLEAAGITPSPEADLRTLLRRVAYDLTGLPPDPEEIEDLISDGRPGAYERVVDRLLASPRFGEHWASSWLNLARYAEDQAHQVGNDEQHFYPNAYRYRDWLIGALNDDLPYDQFIRLQLAADLMEDAGSRGELVALGFLGLGPKYYGRGGLGVMADEWEDRVDTVTRSFLGLTVACARCHDHKFDPIPTEDYHALAGVFASVKMVNKPIPGTETEGLEDEKADEGQEKGKGKEEMKKKKKQPNNRPAPNTVHIVEEADARDLPVFRRGDIEDKGPIVPRHFLRVLSDGEPAPFQRGSGRLELASAIADRRNPLTARVLVNRVWGACFGRPLVGTSSNFGSLGDPPTHPELFDDLAVRFMESDWSLKRLVREIVLSAAYRQESREEPASAAIDPDNVLLWRANRRRLEIEAWRDTILAVSGTLESTAGGPSHDPSEPAGTRRTVYSGISRLQLNDMLRLFDYPDPNVHGPARAATTTPTQKLFVLNSRFLIEKSRALAMRLSRERGPDDAARVERAYRLLHGRGPDVEERRLALEYLSGGGEGDVWERYAHVLLASNELMFLD